MLMSRTLSFKGAEFDVVREVCTISTRIPGRALSTCYEAYKCPLDIPVNVQGVTVWPVRISQERRSPAEFA